MSKIASKVILIEAEPKLTATAILQERASTIPNLEILCGTKVKAICGDGKVESIELENISNSRKDKIKVDGVLVHIGQEPNTVYLESIVPLDNYGKVIVNEKMETKIPHLFAAGDVRSGSSCQIVTAVGDGAIAAISAERLLQVQGGG